LLYIAPERFYNDEFIALLAEVKVKLFAVDEAHCISQWGHDFRPAYLRLKKALNFCGRPPIVALTATATPEVKEDIVKQLEMVNPEKVITGFARPNLQFGVVKANDAQKLQIITDVANSFSGQCGIIYAGTRSKAEEITDRLLETGADAVFYHAGMDNESRAWTQNNFLTGKTKVIVATNAFGLGIDKKDVRFVVHYDLPGTIEAYYQEAGRAGRDGKPSLCLLLYAPRDRFLREFFIKGDNPAPETVLDVYEILKNYETDRIFTTYSELKNNLSDEVPDMAVATCLKILEKEGYVSRSSEKNSPAFFRLLNNFEETLKLVSKQAKKQLEILNKLNERFTRELFSGWEFDPEEVSGIIGAEREALVRSINAWKKTGIAEYDPPKRGTEIRLLKRVERDEIKIDFAAMREKADRAYKKLDEMEAYVFSSGCRPRFILNYFGDGAFPSCGKCDNCLSGNEKGKAQNKKIKDNSSFKRCPPAGAREKVFKKRGKSEFADFEEVKVEKKTLNTKLTQLETLELFNKNHSPAEIASLRNLATGTIYDHLTFLAEKGLIKNIDRLVDNNKQKIIMAAIKKIGAEKLTPIRKELGEDFSWEEIKIVRAFLKIK
jgi:ATP-dependent DNA helicase RecQ